MARKNVVIHQLADNQSLSLGGVTASRVIQALTYTADQGGADGNLISIAYVGDGSAGAETVTLSGLAITVHMDPTAITGSTATNIKAAIDASVPASALLSVSISGSPTAVQAAASAAFLQNGADAAFISNPTVVKYLDNCAYQINVTTSNSEGTFSVQASLDYAKDEVTGAVTNQGRWFNLILSGGIPTVAAEDDVIGIDLNQLPFNAIRLSYAGSVPGTGTCDIFIMARQIGG